MRIAFAVFLSTLGVSFAECFRPTTPAILGNLLWGANSGYDKTARPTLAAHSPNISGHVSPEDVSLQLQLFSVKDVDAVSQTFSIEVYVRTIWYDNRLRYSDLNESACLPSSQKEVSYSPADMQNIWKPDLVFQNAVQAETTFFDAWWLYPDGLVWWARKALLTLSCKMDFTDLPNDVQHCPVLLFGWQTIREEVNTRFWDPALKVTEGASAAGSVEWRLDGVSTTEDAKNSEWGCAFGCKGLKWVFSLARKPNYYNKYVLLPSYLYVFIAWSSFWVSRNAAPARVALTMIIFLVISSQIGSILASLPKLDGPVWLLNHLSMSQCFVLYGIIEYAFCDFLKRIEARVEKARAALESLDTAIRHPEDVCIPNDDPHEATPAPERSGMDSVDIQAFVQKKTGLSGRLCVGRNGRVRLQACRVDQFSRIAFPVAYGIAVALLAK